MAVGIYAELPACCAVGSIGRAFQAELQPAIVGILVIRMNVDATEAFPARNVAALVPDMCCPRMVNSLVMQRPIGWADPNGLIVQAYLAYL